MVRKYLKKEFKSKEKEGKGKEAKGKSVAEKMKNLGGSMSMDQSVMTESGVDFSYLIESNELKFENGRQPVGEQGFFLLSFFLFSFPSFPLPCCLENLKLNSYFSRRDSNCVPSDICGNSLCCESFEEIIE